MTFPSGGPGYPQQGGAQPYQPAPGAGPFPPASPPQPAGTANSMNLPLLLALGVAVLGLVQYFIGFSDEADPASGATRYLLVSGLLAALYALPKGPKALPFAALFSVLGAFEAIDLVIGVPAERSLPGIITVILILGIVQMLVAVGALLLEYGVVKLPAAKPQAPQGPYGQQFGQTGQQPYSQQPQFGQQPQPGQQQPGQQQPGQPQAGQGEPSGSHQPPVNPGPGQQSTTYSQQQGQFFQQPSAEPGQQSPSTPPGGFGQQS